MKTRISIILIVIIILIAIPAIILANDSDSEEEVINMNGKVTLPLIDTMKPDVVKTATFALG